jgi:hypothetical protein
MQLKNRRQSQSQTYTSKDSNLKEPKGSGYGYREVGKKNLGTESKTESNPISERQGTMLQA